VLESRAATETKDLPATLLSRVLTVMGGVAEAVVTSDDNDIIGGDDRHDDASSALDDVLSDEAHAKGTKADGVDESLAPEHATTSSPRAAASLRRTASVTRAAAIADCPLTCSVSAITGSIPRRLSALRAADASIAVTRVWTTMCCIASLERMTTSWIWGDGCACRIEHLFARGCGSCSPRAPPMLRHAAQRSLPRGGAHHR
jgi:hypothetical protein